MQAIRTRSLGAVILAGLLLVPAQLPAAVAGSTDGTSLVFRGRCRGRSRSASR
jgi:hypothetical protein